MSEAKARHEQAATEFQRILDDKLQRASGTAEDLHEILKARFEEAGALSEYLEILRTYSDLLNEPANGKAMHSRLQ